jgi:hypothetical protein
MENSEVKIETPDNVIISNREDVFEEEVIALGLVPETDEAIEPSLEPMLVVNGFIDPTHRFFWTGQQPDGTRHYGSAMETAEVYAQVNAIARCSCQVERNPNFIEPEIVQPVPEEKPLSAYTANDFYIRGYADGDAAYQDVKAAILAWVTEQSLSSNLTLGQEIESLPFVQYVRYNR